MLASDVVMLISAQVQCILTGWILTKHSEKVYPVHAQTIIMILHDMTSRQLWKFEHESTQCYTFNNNRHCPYLFLKQICQVHQFSPSNQHEVLLQAAQSALLSQPPQIDAVVLAPHQTHCLLASHLSASVCHSLSLCQRFSPQARNVQIDNEIYRQ